MVIPEASIKWDNMSPVGDSHKEVDEVKNGELGISRGMACLNPPFQIVFIFSNKPLMAVVFFQMVVVGVMLSVAQLPRHEWRQAKDGMGNFSHDRIQPFMLFRNQRMTGVVPDAPLAPHGETGEDLKRRHGEGLLPHGHRMIRTGCNDGVQKSDACNTCGCVDAKVEERFFRADFENILRECLHERTESRIPLFVVFE